MARKRRTDRLDIGKPFATDRPQPGDMRELQTPAPERDQIDRALIRSYELEQAAKEEYKNSRPREQIEATTRGDTEEDHKKELTRKKLELARERFHLAEEATSRLRADALDDLKFRTGMQWPDEIEKQRSLDGRPCLTMNRLPQFIRQVTNEQRQQRPSIQVQPIGDGSDIETAEILQGIIRHIEVRSDAEIAYDYAFDQMVTGGFGFWRIITDYIQPDSFDQELLIKRVRNPFCVYFDPAAIEPDYSDARYCFIIEDVPRSEFKAQYPNSEVASLSDFSSVGDNASEWATKETIRLAEYFHVEEEPYELCLLTNGETVKASELDETTSQMVQNRRPAIERKVIWEKINAAEVLESNIWPGKYIPVVPVLGDDFDVDGKRYLSGMVRNAKDPQRMYNYWISAGTEMIALAPRAPFIGAEGQFENYEKQWGEANTRNFAYLQYKPTSVAGQLVGPPQRQIYEPPIQSINLMTHQADLDLKATMGIYEPSLGQNKQEQSGRAISLLQKQADVTNLNWVDNLSRSIRYTGKILLDLIRSVYDAPRVQRIIKPDGGINHVVIQNGQDQTADAQQMLSQSIQKIYDINVGDYDVTLSVGPSYQSKRQEAVAGQIAFVQAYPDAFPIIGDIVVGNMDWPQAQEMSKRLKKMLPPQLLAEDDGDPQKKVMALQSQLQAVMQQHEQLTQVVNKQNDVIEQKQIELQGKLESERLRSETQITVAEINTKAQALSERLTMVGDMLKEFHVAAHERGMQAEDHAHERKMQKEAPKPKPTSGTKK